MSRSNQDSLLLEERIEKIRRKNEEIKRRHLEVEADKQNAAKLNALVQLTSPAEEWPVGGRSPSPPPPRSGGRQSEQNGPRQSGGSRSGKIYTFGEGDGPPPDPAYKFLADSERDMQLPRRGRNAGRSRGTGTRDRDKGRGGGMPRPEYEAWRAERNRIDNDRINRQKTAEGHWRREWDNEKISQEEEEPRPIRRNQRGRNSDWNTHRDNTTRMATRAERNSRATTERGRGTRGVSRGNIHDHRVNQVQQSSSSDVAEESYIPANSKRSVVSVGESIKISVSNSPPVRRVKVNAPVIGGTGRVGPRQKIIVSYSSQSEDEAPRSHVVERHVSISSSFRPPLPPSTGPKLENPKPRRQRTKRPDNGRIQGPRKDDTCVKNEEEKENISVEVSQKENESGGDDSWEDVATTSGNESACEDLSPVSKMLRDSEGTNVDEHNEDRSSNKMLTPIIITENGDLNSNVEQIQLDTSESSERIGDQQQ